MKNMSDYLFSFTIGPVQSFIENSRKMRDLYAGSFLLSYLIRNVCDFVDKKKQDMEILRLIPMIPVEQNGQRQSLNVPNRILLKITFPITNYEDNDLADQEMHCLALDMTNAVRSEFKKICRCIFNKCGITPNLAMKNQMKDFPEVYWAYQEFSGEQDFEMISSKIQAVKTVRPFHQISEQAGRKCALFPEYNALFYKEKSEKRPQYIVNESVDIMKTHADAYALNPGEAVCSMAFIKRMLYLMGDREFSCYHYNKNIVSVAYMLLQGAFCRDNEGKKLLGNLSPEGAEAVFDLQNGQMSAEYNGMDCEVAHQLFDYLKRRNVRISPYYAVLKLDGDGIGSIYRQCSYEQQKKLSESMSAFAALVPDIMQRYHGVCIYAGGEDFLGFLPAGQAIPAMTELRKIFQNVVHHPKDQNKKLTLSAGIVFAHLMPSLKNILQMADEMEQQAKNNKDQNGQLVKDSFAMTIYKRSGKTTVLCERFGNECQTLQIIEKLAKKIHEDQLPLSSLHHLLLVFNQFRECTENISIEMLKSIITASVCPLSNQNDNNLGNVLQLINILESYEGSLTKFISALEAAIFLRREEFVCITE